MTFSDNADNHTHTHKCIAHYVPGTELNHSFKKLTPLHTTVTS